MKGRNLLALILAGLAGGCTADGIAFGQHLIGHAAREVISRELNPRQTHVHVHNQGQSPGNQGYRDNKPQLNEYGVPKNGFKGGLCMYSRWVDINKNERAEREEFFEYGKKRFRLGEDEIRVLISFPWEEKNAQYQIWDNKGDLVEEREISVNRGVTSKQVKINSSGKYRITFTTRRGKIYSTDFEIVDEE